MSDLFSAARREYRLFDSSRRRFIPQVRCSMTSGECVEGNEYFAKARCGHLQWCIAVEKGSGETEQGSQPVRTYTIKR